MAKRMRWLWIAVSLVLLSLATACGDFGDEDTSDTPAPDTQPPQDQLADEADPTDVPVDLEADTNEPEDTSDIEDVLPPGTWVSEIHPFVAYTCGGCHSREVEGLATSGPVGSFFGDADANYAYTQVQTYVTPGDISTSLLYEKITSELPSVGDRMPPLPLPVLPEKDVERIRLWIEAGALYE